MCAEFAHDCLMCAEFARDCIMCAELARQLIAALVQARAEAERLKHEEQLLLAGNKIHALTGTSLIRNTHPPRITIGP